MEKNKGKILSSFANKIKLLNNISLSRKLILSYVIIIAVPIITTSFITFKKFENNSKKDIINKSMYQLELESVNINRNIETIQHTAQMVISNRKLKEYISTPYEISLEELVEFNSEDYKNMLQIQYSNPNISGINIFTNNKNIKEIWPLVFYEDRIKNKEWYDKVIDLKGKVFWNLSQRSNDIYDLSYNQTPNWDHVVSVYRSISYPQSTHNGVIRVSMPAKVFFPKMYSNVNDTEGQIYIIDNENKIYTNENSNFIRDKGINNEFIKEQFLENIKLGSSSFNINYDKQHMIGVYTKIEALDSYMLNVSSIDSMLDYTNLIRNVFIAGALILITILSIVTYFITSIILKRLYIIIQSMKRIQQGDFNIEIPVRSNDEIGELAHHFRKMLRKINELIQEAVNKRAVTKEAELRALQTQIDSHFIYNTLENIKMMAEIEEQYLISDSLTSLGAMMRYNMKWNSEYTSLGDEINHIKNYLSLMNMRFDNRINLDINIDGKLMEHDVLKMSLQPIVENTVKHGMRDTFDEKCGQININAVIEGNLIKIEVIDDGVGMEVDKLLLLNEKITDIPAIHGRGNKKDIDGLNKRASTGIGLKNVNERIKLFYGNEYGIEVVSEVNLYTKVIMTLPY
jgi:two-component system, sensor histidine kinase YesM